MLGSQGLAACLICLNVKRPWNAMFYVLSLQNYFQFFRFKSMLKCENIFATHPGANCERFAFWPWGKIRGFMVSVSADKYVRISGFSGLLDLLKRKETLKCDVLCFINALLSIQYLMGELIFGCYVSDHKFLNSCELRTCDHPHCVLVI